MAGLQIKAEQADEALEVLRENLQIFVQQGPTEEELIASKKNITGGFPLRIDSNSDILAYIAVIGYYNLPLNYLDEFNNKIEAVTVEQIKDVFRRHIGTDKLITVMAGPVTGEKQ